MQSRARSDRELHLGRGIGSGPGRRQKDNEDNEEVINDFLLEWEEGGKEAS